MQTIQLDDRSFLDFDRDFVNKELADTLFQHLNDDMDWQETIYTSETGKTIKVPRLRCYMGDENIAIRLFQREPMKWTKQLSELKEKIEKLQNTKFDYVLMAKYRNGKDKIGFHRDQEASEEGKNVIASLSFGATRTFVIKNEADSTKSYTFELPHGSLLVMRGDTQINWVHSLLQDRAVKESRINLTFRKS